MFDHAREFYYPFELNLPPAAAHGWAAQGLGEVIGLEPHPLGHRLHGFGLVEYRGIGPFACLLHLPLSGFDLGQGILDRLDEVRNGEAAFVEVTLGGLLEFLEIRLGELQKTITVLAQGLARQFGKLGLETLLRLHQQFELIFVGLGFGGTPCLQPRHLGALFGQEGQEILTVILLLLPLEFEFADFAVALPQD